MKPVLVLGAARSGLVGLARAVAAGTRGTYADIGASLAPLWEAAQAASEASDIAARIEAMNLVPAGTMPDGRPVLLAADVQEACPNMRAAALLLGHWPHARAIVVWRHGVDFINSRLRAYPQADFVSHCLVWRNAMTHMRRLQASRPIRVHIVQHADLISAPGQVATRIGRFAGLDSAAIGAIGQALAGERPGSSAACFAGPVLDAARAGWSMPEVELYGELCGALSHATGYPVDLTTAERLRPLDLAPRLCASAPGSPVAGDTAGLLRGSALVAGGRTRLRMRLVADDERADIHCEVAESLSQRVILTHVLRPRRSAPASLDAILPSHNGVLDISLRQSPAGSGFTASVREATLSHG